ncbi:MAG TPA: GNAT family N-acetyltransferase [Puia sp.]|jgi:GNAT superfamily N-acetyltransferase|nr:GNAT family N-acetyltransferase [Puia sp.]
MSIRPATIGDGAAISRLLTQLDYPGTEEFVEARLATMLQDPAEVLLVWDDPGVKGFVSLHFIPMIGVGKDFAQISYLIVDDDTRSEGIGRRLEETVTRIARERGCDRIIVHCDSRRIRAHAFYLRQGFEESPKYLIKRL